MAEEADVRLGMWVIYDHPTDMPEWYVARLWRIGPGSLTATNRYIKRDTLEGLRQALDERSPGLIRLERSPDDDPKIMEAWV